MFSSFFKNLFKDVIKTLMTVFSAIIIVVALVFQQYWVIPLWKAIVIAISVAVVAVGTDSKWLMNAINVGGLIAGAMLGFADPTQLAGFLGTQMGTWAQAAYLAYMGLGPWVRTAVFMFSAWTTYASIRANSNGTTLFTEMSESAMEVIDTVIDVVTDIADSVLGAVLGVASRGFSSLLSSPLGIALLIGGAYFVLKDDGTTTREIVKEDQRVPTSS